MITYWLKRKCYWLNDFLSGGRMWWHFRDVRRIMSDPCRSEALLDKRLAEMLSYARSCIRFYSDVPGEGLKDFPVVNKVIILKSLDDFVRGDRSQYICHTTSGSTGTPFTAYQDKDSNVRRIATIKASNEVYGFHSCIPMLYIRTLEVPDPQGRMLRCERNQNIWYGYIADYEDATFDRVFSLIEDKGIRFVRGYASLIDSLTEYAVRSGRKLPEGLVFVTISEMLTEIVRSRIVDRLGLHVIAQYANEENGLLGQSELDGPGNVFRLNKANCKMELLSLDSDEPVAVGETGRVVLTDLTNRAMPLLRYDIGDVAVCLEALPDGEPLVIKLLDCRRSDMVYDTSGKLVPMVFPSELWSVPDLRQVQFVQEDVKEYSLTLNIGSGVPELGFVGSGAVDSGAVDSSAVSSGVVDSGAAESGAPAFDGSWLEAIFKELLGQDAVVKVAVVNGMPELSSRKRKICVQKCSRYLAK